MHEFVIMIDGKLQTFNNYEDIPNKFDHVIKFRPHVPEGPHTEEQHEEIEQWNTKLQRLMEIERASSM
tara:strand:- start:7539 stop:7742 length:204 start_codon:yes stop_codon:yes gene_type:complete